MFAKFFRTPVIILNSKEAAVDLMEKRSAKYSDRPPLIVLRELYVFRLFVPPPHRLIFVQHGLGQHGQHSPLRRTFPQASQVAPGCVCVQGCRDGLSSHSAARNLRFAIWTLRSTRPLYGSHHTARCAYSRIIEVDNILTLYM